MSGQGVVAVGLAKRFTTAPTDDYALPPVNLTVNAGDIRCITGRSGTGKSTLLKILAGLETPTTGSATVAGVDVAAQHRRGRRVPGVSLVFQDYNLIPELSVLENIVLAQRLAGNPPDAEAARAGLRTMGIEELAPRFPATLSGGEQQRTAIARTLATRSTVILADEPTGALDEHNARLVVEALQAAARTGIAVLVATHDPIVVAAVGNPLCLDRGAGR